MVSHWFTQTHAICVNDMGKFVSKKNSVLPIGNLSEKSKMQYQLSKFFFCQNYDQTGHRALMEKIPFYRSYSSQMECKSELKKSFPSELQFYNQNLARNI